MLSMPEKNVGSLSCKQVQKANTFSSQQIKTIFHNVNWASSYVTYMMEFILCNKQYVGKAETSFNIRMNNHQKDVKKVNTIMACIHFQ